MLKLFLVGLLAGVLGFARSGSARACDCHCSMMAMRADQAMPGHAGHQIAASRPTTPSLSMVHSSMFAQADHPTSKPEAKSETKHETAKATFLITGLHCPPCTRTVEDSLRGVKGVKSVKVDWNSKNARVEFDEQVIPAEQLSQRIAETPHMMGGNLQYSGWLALKVSDPKEKDDAAWERIKETLSKVPGVKQVAIYKTQSGVGVRFDGKGKLTSQKLLSALADAGFKASNY
ncbi:MAG: cation transporter [Thermomicrobiales bacterium]